MTKVDNQTPGAKPAGVAPGENQDFRALGQRLRDAREALGYSIKKMSEACGITYGYISDTERGKNLPATKYIYFLAHQGVNLNYIYRAEGPPLISPSNRPIQLDRFGKMGEEVEEILAYMEKNKSLLYHMLECFNDYIQDNRDRMMHPGEEPPNDTGTEDDT